MTKGEARVLETDVVNFPMEFGQENQDAAAEIPAKTAGEKKSIKTDMEARFTRLKKSLRKRSVSIL